MQGEARRSKAKRIAISFANNKSFIMWLLERKKRKKDVLAQVEEEEEEGGRWMPCHAGPSEEITTADTTVHRLKIL